MPVHDIIIHYVKGEDKRPEDFPAEERPPSERFQIAERFWIGRLNETTALQVFEACTPRASGFERPTPPLHQIYVYGKDVLFSRSIKQQWDASKELQNLVAFSRLVCPTSASLRLAARVELDGEGRAEWISPAELTGVQLDAYTAPGTSRDWLVLSELRELKDLVEGWNGPPS